MNDLARAAISQRIARAERDGLVVRRRAVGPSRAVWVDLTPRGHAVVDRTVDHVLGQEVELLDALDDDQQASLAELLRILMQDVRRRYGDVPPTHVGT